MTDRSVVAYIDGGSRGNPGPAGAGVHFVLAGKDWKGLYFYLGRQTNNVAEYSALLRALEHALQSGFRRMQVYSDSELLVRQIRGTYRVKNETLQVLHGRAVEMIGHFATCGISHVPRAQNRRADALANRAMDERESGEIDYSS